MNGATPASHPRDGKYVQSNASQRAPPGHPGYPVQPPTGMPVPHQMQPGSVQRQSVSSMGKWHTSKDIPHRRELINNIIRLFQQRRPNITKDCQKKLPDFVRRLESALYHSAPSLEDYLDLKTLEQRLQSVARRLMMRGRPPSHPIPNAMPLPGQMPPHNSQMAPGQMPPGQMPPGQMPNGVQVSSQMMQGQMGNVMQVPSSMPHQHIHNNMYPSRTSSNGSVAQQVGPNNVRSHTVMPGDAVPQNGPTMLRVPSHQHAAMSRGHSMGMRTPVSGMDGRMHGQQLDVDMMQHHPSMMAGTGSHMNPYRHQEQDMNASNRMAHSGMNGHGMHQSGPVMSNGAPVLRRNASFPGTPSISDGMLSSSGHHRVTINGMAPGQLPNHSGHLITGSSVVQQGVHYPPMSTNGPYEQKPENFSMQNVKMPSGSMPIASMPMASMPMASMPMAGPPTVSMPPTHSRPSREEQHRLFIMKQIRWLLFLRHAHKCTAPEGQCSAGQHCVVARQLWQHVLKCVDPKCKYPRCVASRELLKHHQKCIDPRCALCGPVREHIDSQRNRQLAAEQYRLQQAKQEQKIQQAHLAGTPVPQMQASYHSKPVVMMPPAIPPKKESKKSMPKMEGPPTKKIKVEPSMDRRKVKSEAKEKSPQGTSLLECFDATQIKTHLASLRLETMGNATVAQSARSMEAEGKRLMERASDQACRACGAVRLSFEPQMQSYYIVEYKIFYDM